MTSAAQPPSPQRETKSQAATLVEIAKLYERQLHGDDPRGRQMLKRLGIHSKETITSFGIGYADGNLKAKVNDDQAKTLQAMGLISHNNRESLGNALVFPVRDPEFGAIVDLYAIKEFRNNKVNLYAPSRGLLNAKALNASDEIILTDWLEAALLIHQAGWHAVIPIRSIEDLEANLPHIEKARPRRLWIGSVKLGKQMALLLKPFGCEVLNLALRRELQNITAETLKGQMDSAQSLQQANPRPVLTEVLEDGGVFEQHGCLFKLSGLKDAGASSLKLILTASCENKIHTDRIDLLSASSRKRFANDAEAALGLSKKDMETVLLDLIPETEELLAERKRRQAHLGCGLKMNLDGRLDMPQDRKQEALAGLRDPKLLDNVLDDIARLGLVGERDNALLLYLVAVSRKLRKPLSGILCSESAAGKSNLVERIVDLLPEEDVIYVSRLSSNALFYMPPDSLRHRLLVVEERNGSEESEYAIRILQSKGYLTTALPLPPEEPGILRTKLITVQGPVAYVETTTNPDIDPQNLNRCFEVRLDETPEQTANVLKDRQQRRTQTHERTSRKTRLQLHHDMQRLIEPLPVLIPYAHHLTFPSRQVRYRRDHERLLGLIDASCLLHQYQREIITNPRGERMIVATVEDYATAHRLVSVALRLSTDELTSHAREGWRAILEYKGEPFTRRQLMERLDWSYRKTYATLQELTTHELLSHDGGTGSKPRFFKANSSNPISPEIGLLCPKELERLLSVAVR